MDSRKHTRFTGAKAKISRKVNGGIYYYDGYIEGFTWICPDKRLSSHARQRLAGRFTFLKPPSAEKNQERARLYFHQSGVPVQHYHDISQGWRDYYWIPMKEMLEKRN